MIPPLISNVPAPRSFSDGLWGVPAKQLHELYWLGHNVIVVRQGAVLPPPIEGGTYLLLPAHSGLLLEPAKIAEMVQLVGRYPLLRLQVALSSPGFQERVEVDADGKVLRLRRSYLLPRRKRGILVTGDRRAAEVWRTAIDAWLGYRLLYKYFPRNGVHRLDVPGKSLDSWDQQFQDICDWMARHSRKPLAAGTFPQMVAPGVWRGSGTDIHPNARLVGPIWIGDDCQIRANAVIVGPKSVLDGSIVDGPLVAMEPRPDGQSDIGHRQMTNPPANPYLNGPVKRFLDVVVSLCAIAFSLPFYPLIMLAIWMEDGRPFFFAHRRESSAGQEFPCVKFRTMRKDAHGMAASLKQENWADGPQFYIPLDPRVTRIGKILRKSHLDELPQFFNVLVGHMSVVGPRPSPHRENQFCPEWREARLSVKPGITGLWQMLRTREPQRDFQEWISYDMQYVQHGSMLLDLWLIIVTMFRVVSIKIYFLPRMFGVRPLERETHSTLNAVPRAAT